MFFADFLVIKGLQGSVVNSQKPDSHQIHSKSHGTDTYPSTLPFTDDAATWSPTSPPEEEERESKIAFSDSIEYNEGEEVLIFKFIEFIQSFICVKTHDTSYSKLSNFLFCCGMANSSIFPKKREILCTIQL